MRTIRGGIMRMVSQNKVRRVLIRSYIENIEREADGNPP